MDERVGKGSEKEIMSYEHKVVYQYLNLACFYAMSTFETGEQDQASAVILCFVTFLGKKSYSIQN